MISHDLKCIFIHIPKCAGTSIEKALGHYEGHRGRGGQDHRTIRMIEHPYPRLSVFLSKENLKEAYCRMRYQSWEIHNPRNRFICTKKQYREYYKFTIVRNPWARAYSWYKGVIRDPWHQKNLGIDDKITFKEYMQKFAGKDMLRPQLDYIINFEGKVELDHVGRFENLAAEFEKVCNDMNLKNVSLPHELKGSGDNFRDHYDEETVKLVDNIYTEEIEMFGYQFDG